MYSVYILQPAPTKLEEAQKYLFSSDFLLFLETLFDQFDAEIDELYKDRLERKHELRRNCNLDFKESPARRDKTWRVAPLPQRLRCRNVDLGDVSPSNTVHLADALNSDVQGVQVDFDDGHCPTWRGQIQGYHNVCLAVDGKLPGAPAHLSACPILMLRPRAWNIIEHNVIVRGKEIAGPLLDFAILMYHVGRKLHQCGCGPFFYLSKLEGATEAALWNKIFIWTQRELDIPLGSIKACVLIENIVSVFELDEILFELREHSMGLNCGIWDYAASIVAKFGDRKQFLLPDRNKYVNMEKKFLKSYLQLVVRVCHERGTLATGGMAAAVLPSGVDSSDERCKSKINKVLEAKSREMDDGVDGFLVYDLRLVPHVNQLWKKYGDSNPKTPSAKIAASDLLTMPSGGCTLEGLEHNIAVSILFVYHWLSGTGHFFYKGNVEDSATAEISRSQIWQWIRFAPPLEDSSSVSVTVQLVDKMAAEFATKAHKNLCRSNAERKRLTAARYMCMELFCLRDFPEFITTYLNDNHKFRTLHNKALLNKL